jgi:hypothetical protein
VRIPYLKTIRTSISDGSLQPDLHFWVRPKKHKAWHGDFYKITK